jgi:hypothetical protein
MFWKKKEREVPVTERTDELKFALLVSLPFCDSFSPLLPFFPLPSLLLTSSPLQGAGGVGKTAFMDRYFWDTFSNAYDPCIGDECRTKFVAVDDVQQKIEVS